MRLLTTILALSLFLPLCGQEVTNALGAVVAEIETRTFKLNHVSAAEMADKFNAMWNGEFGQVWKVTRMAVAFDESNTVLVTAPRPILDACERSIRELDVEPQQVYIEARFVELGNTASHKVGIDWRMLDGMQGSVKLGGGIDEHHLGSGVAGYHTVSGISEYEHTGYDLGAGNGRITYFNGTLDFS